MYAGLYRPFLLMRVYYNIALDSHTCPQLFALSFRSRLASKYLGIIFFLFPKIIVNLYSGVINL